MAHVSVWYHCRLDQAASDADIMTLQTFVDTRLCGGSVHPYGIQLLAQRLLKVNYCRDVMRHTD